MYLHNYLSPNGIYVIEGIQPDNIEKFKDLSIFPSNFKDYILNTFKIEYFDTRNSNDSLREDDFMMSFTKLYYNDYNNFYDFGVKTVNIFVLIIIYLF